MLISPQWLLKARTLNAANSNFEDLAKKYVAKRSHASNKFPWSEKRNSNSAALILLGILHEQI